MELAMEVVRDIAAVIGLILSVASLVTLCTTGGRKLIYRWVKSNTKDLQDTNQKQNEDIEEIKLILQNLQEKVNILSNDDAAIKEVLIQQCRNTIKNIYYKYHNVKTIPLYERKTVDKTYKIYVNSFHGNSYIELLYSEICKWEIDTVNYPVLEED